MLQIIPNRIQVVQQIWKDIDHFGYTNLDLFDFVVNRYVYLISIADN